MVGIANTHDHFIDFLLRELATFTGNDWEQEDDVTLVALAHVP